jgi:GTP-binding protein
LGLEFLRHIERTKLLIYVLDASGLEGRTPIEDYTVLRHELESYNPELLQRPYLVVLNKIDLESAEEYIKEFSKHFSFKKGVVHEVSALCGDGLESLRASIESIYASLQY